MQHQRQGDQTQHLKEEIQRQNIFRHRHTQGDPVGDQIEQKEGTLILLMLHVLEGIETGEGPQSCHQCRVEASWAVQLQGNTQVSGKAEHRERPCRVVQKQGKHKH